MQYQLESEIYCFGGPTAYLCLLVFFFPGNTEVLGLRLSFDFDLFFKSSQAFDNGRCSGMFMVAAK